MRGANAASLRDVATESVVASTESVTGLRLWGSEVVHDLSAASCDTLLVGTSSACTIRLDDRNTALKHAHVTLDGGQWWLRDLGTPHGVREDGVLRSGFMLTPGVEIGIGATTLVAESTSTARLRAFCRRLLGWGSDRLRAVDRALRAIRLTRAHRTPLVLCGEGDLVPIAHALHRYTLGTTAPFIVCDRRRRDAVASVRAPPSVSRALEAFTRAAGGTLCLRYPRLPDHIDEVMRRGYEPDSEVQLVLCAPRQHRGAAIAGALSIQLPPLQLREAELSRIVAEYAADAISTLDVNPEYFDDDDREWVLGCCAQSLQEIEKATLRVVALVASGSLAEAAARLGMAPVSLARWVRRRPPRGGAKPTGAGGHPSR